jgi:hypothetical protein
MKAPRPQKPGCFLMGCRWRYKARWAVCWGWVAHGSQMGQGLWVALMGASVPQWETGGES